MEERELGLGVPISPGDLKLDWESWPLALVEEPIDFEVLDLGVVVDELLSLCDDLVRVVLLVEIEAEGPSIISCIPGSVLRESALRGFGGMLTESGTESEERSRAGHR